MKNRIKADMKRAMIGKDTMTRDTLRVLIAEIERNEQSSKGKVELSDTEIVTLVKKMVNDIKESNPNSDEIKILEHYLPIELSVLFMGEEVQRQIELHGYSGMKDMGKIMKHFKDVFPNQYNGKVLSAIIKERLV